MRTKLLNTTVNKNQRKYDLPLLELIRDQINSSDPDRNIGTLGTFSSDAVPLAQAAFLYKNARVEGDSLYAEIELLDTPAGKKLKGMLADVVFRPAGIGNLSVSMGIRVVQDDYELVSVNAIPREEDSLNESDAEDKT